MKLDSDVASMSRKLQQFFFNINTANLLIILVITGVILLIFGSIKESVVNSQSIILIIISMFGMYLYFKKEFNARLKTLKMKNKVLKKNSILDDVCETKKNSKSPLCTQYKNAKRNFYTISNLLLQQYNIK